jgi:hypothetical protein
LILLIFASIKNLIRFKNIVLMSEKDSVKQNVIYDLIVNNDLKDSYDWKAM